MVQLSQQAINELKIILKKDLGDAFDNLSEDNIQHIGNFMLHITATALKMRYEKDGRCENIGLY